MKKGFLLGALLLSAGAVSAQNFYVGLQGGYGFGTPSEVVGTVASISATGESSEMNVFGTYGGGTNIGLNVGYMFNEHFGGELGFNYFLGSSITSTDFTVPTGNATVMGKSNQMRLAPSIVLSTGGDFAVYTKGGLILPVGGSTMVEYRDNRNPASVLEQDFEIKGSPSVGFQGALGLSYNVLDNLSIFGEMSIVNLRIKPATQSMTRSLENGIDVLAAMDTYDKEIVYVDALGADSNNSGFNGSYSTDEAMDELSRSTNFNGMFINVGVKLSF